MVVLWFENVSSTLLNSIQSNFSLRCTILRGLVDVRRVISRFSSENMGANQPLLHLIGQFAEAKGCAKAQIARAWVLRGGDFIVPRPGMRSKERILENLGAADIELTDNEYHRLNVEPSKIEVHGSRSGKDIQKLGTVPGNAKV